MRFSTTLLAGFIANCFIFTLATSAYADLGDQLAKLLPKDGAAGDRFGRSVAISSSITIVGSFLDDDNGINSGSAYIFNTTTGEQLFKLLPIDGAADDWFGRSVAIGGCLGNQVAIVGASGDDDNGINSGSAYLFDANSGAQIVKLLPVDGMEGDRFGSFVAINNSTAIVGAVLDDDNGIDSGSAYIFDISDPANPKQIVKLLANDGAADDVFGFSVGIGGLPGKEIAIVGAAGDDDNGSVSGSTYLFDASTGQQIAKLLPDDGASHDGFGNSVAISGALAIVGARAADDLGNASGSAYLFDVTTGKQVAKILPNDGAGGDSFGYSVAISGPLGNEIVIVGAIGDDDNGSASGSAYLFDISDPSSPIQIAKLLPDDGDVLNVFGNSVAISNLPGKTIAIIGSARDNTNGDDSGSAYIFDAANMSACPWDLDKSGSVGTSDLLELFAQWGTSGTGDFNGDGIVSTNDLLILLANWGPCE